ncbi:FepA family TonB-dependent siderophore receptor [Falsirhodobacter sp. 20TX0035]|uniref:FepA family TonB-dependent siderophore receptor n=1 Tax=Falsirhodobacter sp. 20TX0035 TaxID=3022019 RepID=UPI002330AAD2|nr:FepA family TonB-dependent siderophore receptor [Falsirhodobacter sp. 20TX0035]MDB6453905.1 FepA family TonB-dependent siderophore receptor [Falsirhodobacter sp. 20TX0035]
MARRVPHTISHAILALMASTAPVWAQEVPADGPEVTVLPPIIVKSYEEAVRQALGTSTITEEQIEKTPVANDISELIRKQPGVNLTGASATGQRGNQRQIDIRGMGPENTLILIDGKPVLSRNSVKMGRGGERDTRGDSNWVPAELIDQIEVIRGPAAARYGSGAAGGVVNIITKMPTEESLTVSTHFDFPESSDEGDTKRLNLIWSKPLNDRLALRFTANANKTDADAYDINAGAVAGETCYNRAGAVTECSVPAGNEGVRNRDLNGLLRWTPNDQNTFDFELGYSRQGNIFAGDTQLSNGSTSANADFLQSLQGTETNVLRRRTAALTHRGTYGFGESMSYLQFEKTSNTRLLEGTAGSGEGAINALDFGTVDLRNISGKTEWVLPGQIFGRLATWTLGSEVRYERINDPVLVTSAGDIDLGVGGTADSAGDRDPVLDQTLVGLYAEGNIELSDRLSLAPSLRADWSEDYGTTFSGGLNASYRVTDNWTVKGGVARAFKAPNLYQVSPNYIYTTRGNGCPVGVEGPCYVLGNADLEPETSVNAELGVAYENDFGVAATLTAFHNNYRNRIQSGDTLRAQASCDFDEDPSTVDSACKVFQWENIPRAVITGLEGSFSTPLADTLSLTTNLTYMIKSENKDTGDPLSLVPKYTVNAALEWDATDNWTIIPALTHYGKIEAAQFNALTGADATSTEDRDPYTLVNLSTRYVMDNGVSLTGGITNLLDKDVDRTGVGANTFNEPGRAVYLGLSKTF